MRDDDGDESNPSKADRDVRHAAPSWLIDFRMSDYRKGFYISGESFGVVFADRGNENLIVSFDNLSSSRDNSIAREPWGYSFVAKKGWSQLGVMTFESSWFRDDALFSYLRNLSEEGFFNRFGRITMTGTSMGGYAACAFASLAPGCVVVAFSPQSTLNAELVPWEERFSSGRKADWSGPFADAAVESAAASKVYLVYDPNFEPDLRHVKRFDHSNAVPLKARYAGHKSALFLRRAGLLSKVVTDAVERQLTPTSFYQAYRGARSLPWFANGLRTRLTATGRQKFLPRVARGLEKLRTPMGGDNHVGISGTHSTKPFSTSIKGLITPAGGDAISHNKRFSPKFNDPTPAADLYMSSPNLPPPVASVDLLWTAYRDAEQSSKAPWVFPRTFDEIIRPPRRQDGRNC